MNNWAWVLTHAAFIATRLWEALTLLLCFMTGEEDSVEVKWMTLFEGEPKRCGCGKWFKLVTVSPEHPHLDQKLQ